MRSYVNRHSIAMRLITLVIAVLVFALPCFASSSYADSSITLTLSGPTSEIHAGDVATITVTADKLEHITRFGPIDLAFNNQDVEFVAIWPVTELAAFTYTVDDSTPGHFLVSAVDQAVEADIAASQVSGEIEDNSINYDSETVLFTISFRVSSYSSANIRFWIDSVAGFRDSSMNDVEAIIGDGVTVEVAPSLSDDASLTELSIDDVTLSPEFDPGVYEYSASVGRDVHSLSLDVTAGNTWATVEVVGTERLQFGENIVVITVTAQDGQTQSEYKIYVTRQDDSVAIGAGFVDAHGNSYTFVALPSNYSVPDGFEESERVINGYNVTVFAKEGVSSVLIYAYDGVNEPSFYFYNSITKVTTRYESLNYIYMPSRVLTAVVVPSIVKIPEGFSPAVMSVDGVDIEGFQNSDGTFISYLKDEEGNAEFYRYDEKSGRFVDYKSVDRTLEKIYSTLFYIFLGLTIVESIMIIVMVIIVRRVIVVRANPKPRRV